VEDISSTDSSYDVNDSIKEIREYAEKVFAWLDDLEPSESHYYTA
jgi:hypothetical protein